MAFPGTYNFTYYKGDTFEFRISPRNADGTVFDLTGYEAAFTISTARGAAGQANRRSGYSVISGSDVFCAITPTASETLPPATSYVYDVEIRNLTSTPYPKVYTLLTGNITIQDQITDIDVVEPEPEESGESGIDVVINPPTNFQILSVTDTTITFDWDPPLSGGAAFIAYLPGYVTVPPDVQIDGQTGLPTNVTFGSPIPVVSGVTTHTFTGLSPLTTYRVGVVATDGTSFSNLNASLLATTEASEESGESGLESYDPIIINPPQNVTVANTTSTTIDIDWDAPAEGGDPYVAYVVGIASPLDPTNITVVATIPVASGITNYQYTGLTPATSYIVGVVATDGTNSSDPELSAELTATLGE
jgi:hypothetical protein